METVSKAARQLIIKQPYYGLFLCGLNKRFDKRISTACIGLEGINPTIRISQEYWKSLKLEQRMATLMHELGHLMYYHCTNFDYWQTVCPDHQILNIAMDMVVESAIPEAWWDEKGITAEDLFRKFPDLPKNQGTHFYIKFLMSLRKKAFASKDINSKYDDIQENKIQEAVKKLQQASKALADKMSGIKTSDKYMQDRISDVLSGNNKIQNLSEKILKK